MRINTFICIVYTCDKYETFFKYEPLYNA